MATPDRACRGSGAPVTDSRHRPPPTRRGSDADALALPRASTQSAGHAAELAAERRRDLHNTQRQVRRAAHRRAGKSLAYCDPQTDLPDAGTACAEFQPTPAAENCTGVGSTGIIDYQVRPRASRVPPRQEAQSHTVVDTVRARPTARYEGANGSSGGGSVDQSLAEALGWDRACRRRSRSLDGGQVARG
jgi:hypothetical protein